MKIDGFLKLEYGELEKRLIDTYHKQKLSLNSFKIARVISFLSILIILIFGWGESNWFFLLLWLIGLGVEGYRFFNPNSESEEILDELKQIALFFENYKKCVTGEAEIELEEKQFKQATKQIEKCMPYLLKNSTFAKVLAFIPIVSVFDDEMSSYRHHYGASYKLLKSGYFPRFNNENVKFKAGVSNVEKGKAVKLEEIKEVKEVKSDIPKEVKSEVIKESRVIKEINETKEKKIRLYLNKEAIEAFVGTPKKIEWYLSAFNKSNVNGIDKLSWNWSWPAFFFGGLYLLYRKCYLEGIIISIVQFFLGPFALIINILFGGFLPYLYYKKFKKIALEVENVESDFDEQIQMLKQFGGVNKLAVFIGIGLSTLISVIIFLVTSGSQM